MGDFYTFENVELVRIGQGAARIVKVDEHAIHYVNEAGNPLEIDLDECRRMFRALEITGQIPPRNDSDWAGAWDGLSSQEKKITGDGIGMRARVDSPPWFQFCNRRRTQFEFTDSAQMNLLLMDPLVRSGGAAGSFDCS